MATNVNGSFQEDFYGSTWHWRQKNILEVLGVGIVHFLRTRQSGWKTGPRFNIKMSSYQYRKSDCGDKTVVRSSYLHNGISYTGKMASLYWFSPLNILHYVYDIQYILKYTKCLFSKITNQNVDCEMTTIYLTLNVLNHCGLMIPNGYINLCQP